jgi:predicted flap endonuclease-1-like 5' DNA nuclease
MSKIEEIEGVGPAYAEKLAAAGIKSVANLLEKCATRKGRTAVAEATGISDKLILKWANHADLMRIDGVGPEFAELLEAAGVDTVKELRNRNAENLAKAMAEKNEEKKLTRVTPSAERVAKWVAEAKTLDPIMTY